MRYKDNQKAEEMRSHIQAYQSGELTIERYCQQHSLKKSSYYYWYKRLQKQREAKSFIPLNFSNTQGDDIVVTFPNGVSISFNGNVTTSVLKELVCCM